MKVRYRVLAALPAFLFLMVSAASMAVDIGPIEQVRRKEVLDGEDLQIIDSFVAEAVEELLRTRDFGSIAGIRTIILSRSTSSADSARAQYAQQFGASAYNHISEALRETESFDRQDRKFIVTLNLLILADSLENPQLAYLAIPMLRHGNTVIRYWAVHSVTNPGMREKLRPENPDNLKLLQRIVEQLEELLDNSSPEIVALIAEFAAGVQIPQGRQLLGRIADMRIKRYENWTVEYELLDATILKLLCENVSGSGQTDAAMARRFGLLYSYAIQRYVKGAVLLTDARKQQLASVLVETAEQCIRKLLGAAQPTIKRAVEENDYAALLLEHSKLLGDETRAGELAVKLKFDYGENPDGSRRTAPPALAEPPKPQTTG